MALVTLVAFAFATLVTLALIVLIAMEIWYFWSLDCIKFLAVLDYRIDSIYTSS